jgi:hypothetical protein
MALKSLFATWAAQGRNALAECLLMLGAQPFLPAV